VAVKARDGRGRGIKLNRNQDVSKRMQTTTRRASERKGGQRVKTQTADESDIRPTCWYVVPMLPILVRPMINFSRKIGYLRWNMHMFIKKETRTSCDIHIINVEVLMNYRVREIRRVGLAPRKGEDHSLKKSRSKPCQSMILARPIGINGREPEGKKEATQWKKNPRNLAIQENKQSWGGGI